MAEHGSNSRPDRHALVTGGAGFIGSHLVDALLAEGWHVTVVDTLETGRRDNLPASAPGFTFVESALGEAIESGSLDGGHFSEIYHMAASVGVKRIMDNQVASIRTNVEETSTLLRWVANGQDWSRRHKPATDVDGQTGAAAAKVLIASSSEVYGKSAKAPFSEDDDVLYGNTTVHRWSYACAKAIDEFLALAYFRERQMPVVVARLFNTVGPRQLGSYGMVLPNFVASALAGRELVIHGDGQQSRCFCDVRDVRDALVALVAGAETSGRVFNIGSADSISIVDLARRVISVLGSRSAISFVSYEQAYGPGFEDLRQRQPDLSRICGATPWRPRISLDQTIQDIAAEQIESEGGGSKSASKSATGSEPGPSAGSSADSSARLAGRVVIASPSVARLAAPKLGAPTGKEIRS